MAISQLPFPHGTSSGQIANNAQVSLTDTPGSTGGRFVGFGEQGTSAVANRAAWALSLNIDTIFTSILSLPISVNAALAFTSSGQDSIQIAGVSVFCGDSTYPGSPPTDPEGMHALFSVLDSQYNPLIDVSGNEVKVYAVYDPTNTSSVYKTGYVTGPWVHFCTVDPLTGAIVNADYTIPLSTAVRLVYGVRSNLKDLPFDHPDAFTRFRSLTGEDVPAGVVLQDGSRAMTGDLSLANHNIVNCQSIGLAPFGSPSSGIGVMNPINVTPVAGYAPNIFMTYEASGAQINAKETYATLEMVSPVGYFASVAMAMAANLGSATPDADWVLTVVSAGATTRQLKLNSTAGSLGPVTGSVLSLGTAALPWNNAYLTTLYAPTSDTYGAVRFGSLIGGIFDGAAVGFNDPISMSRSPGHGTFIEMVYDQSGSELPGQAVVNYLNMRSWDGNVAMTMSLYGDMSDPSTTASSLEWVMTNNAFGDIGMVLDRSPSFPSLRPITSGGLFLGNPSRKWEGAWFNNLASTYGSIDDLTILTSKALSTSDGATPILLEKAKDFECFVDFGSEYFSVITGAVIDPSFAFYGSAGCGASATVPVYGRATLANILVDATAGHAARIDGPLYIGLGSNSFHCRVGVAVAQLSGVSTTFFWRCGFRSSSYWAAPSAWFQMGDDNSLEISFDDGNGSSGNYVAAFSMVAQQFYDIDVILTPGFLNVAVNDVLVSPSPIIFNPVDPSVAMWATPMEVTNEGGTGTVTVVVDYVHIYSEGHVARSINGL